MSGAHPSIERPEMEPIVTTPSRDRWAFHSSRRWRIFEFREFWQFREILFFLVWKDVKIRYKQTFLGVTWAILQPLLTMIIFSLVFGRWAKIPSSGVPYPVFILCALLPWQIFSISLTQAGQSLVANQPLVAKVYFPRIFIPLSTILGGLVDFAAAMPLLIVLLLAYQISIPIMIWAAPLFVVAAIATALAAALWLSALHVRYRDVRHALPFLNQVWFFVTPIAYPITLVPEHWRAIYALNPMVGVIEGFRWTLLGTAGLSPLEWGVSLLSLLLLLTSGIVYFLRSEDEFADLI